MDDEWELFLTGEIPTIVPTSESGVAPSPTDLYVSTNTVISYFDTAIQLADIFWSIPILPYNTYDMGVIKKQMKFNSTNADELKVIETNVSGYECSNVKIIRHIEGDERLGYKDIRIVTIGVSKKDIVSYRPKNKSAFYNCFALIIRVCLEGQYKEFHVKIFNTGKIEIPGIQNTLHIPIIIDMLLQLLRVHYPAIAYNKYCEETVLINSNFSCGFFVKRYELCTILKTKYNISAVYDPCSYPGIQCKIYYNEDKVCTSIHPIVVSFMVFRTGSVLIVGKCSEKIIREIYKYLSDILIKEYGEIVNTNCNHSKKNVLSRKSKKIILLS